LQPNLEAKGYHVFVRPQDSILPPFLQGKRADAIALRDDRKLVIAVMPGIGEPSGKIPALDAALADHPDWELQVFTSNGDTEALTLPTMTPQAITDQANRLLDIFDTAGPIPALLTAWSLVEAASRLLMPEAFSRRQTNGSLMERLAFEGWVTPDEAEFLRPLGRLWNRAAHGDLDVKVTRQDIAALADIVRLLLDLAAREAETSAKDAVGA